MLVEAEAAHKLFASKIVLPVMSITTVAFYTATVSSTKQAILVTIGGVLITILNFWITTLTGTWRSTNFKPRADLVDAVRWAFNLLVFDTAIMALLRPSTSTLVITWTILLLAASADMFRQAYRTAVVGMGLVSGVILVFTVTQDVQGWREQIFAIFGMLTIVYIFFRIETYWTTELQTRIQSQKEATDAGFLIKGLTRDAMLGVQSRMISHELANLIQVLDLIALKNDSPEQEKIRRTIYYIKRVNKLVLHDLGHSEFEKRDNFGSTIDYIKMLVSKEMGLGDIGLNIETDEKTRAFEYLEYSGSLFLILRNLIKNAADATKAIESFHDVRITAAVVDERLKIDITDFGHGMDASTLSSLLAGKGKTSRIFGSGIGFKFVLEQCNKNNFILTANSAPGKGSTFTISILPAGQASRGKSSIVG